MRLFVESSKIALKAIWTNKLRSGLTSLGVILGVFTITTLVSISLGVKEEVVSQIEGLGGNFVAVVPGKITTSEGGLNPTAQVGASTLTERDFEAINKNLPQVQNLSMTMLISGTVRADERVSNTTLIFAATERILPILNSNVSLGRTLNKKDLEGKARVVVLGSGATKTLFPGVSPIGQELAIRGEKFKVVGTLAEREEAATFFGPNINDLAIIPLSTGWEIVGTRQIFRIVMQAPSTDLVKETQREVKDLVLKNHGGEEDFTVLTQEDALGIASSILNILTAMLAAIAAISLVVGGVGIMNIMLVSVSERTKEIGIRKAVGAESKHILMQFLIEAATLSFLGGIIGVTITTIGAFFVSKYSALPISLQPLIIFGGLSFSIVTGIVFGVAPAAAAAKKDPIAALRSE